MSALVVMFPILLTFHIPKSKTATLVPTAQHKSFSAIVSNVCLANLKGEMPELKHKHGFYFMM